MTKASKMDFILSQNREKREKEEDTVKYLHLFVGATRREVFYLGYPLDLTEKEFSIVRILALSGGNTLNPDQIAISCSLSGGARGVAIDIHNVNCKARAIGGRNLVKNHKNQGYFLNDEM